MKVYVVLWCMPYVDDTKVKAVFSTRKLAEDYAETLTRDHYGDGDGPAVASILVGVEEFEIDAHAMTSTVNVTDR